MKTRKRTKLIVFSILLGVALTPGVLWVNPSLVTWQLSGSKPYKNSHPVDSPYLQSTSLGVGNARLHMDGLKPADVIQLLGKPSYKAAFAFQRTHQSTYPHLWWGYELPTFDSRWFYASELSDVTIFWKNGKVAFALLMYCDY